MRRISLTVLFLLIGLLWKIAPGKTLSDMLLMTGAEGVVVGGVEPAVPFRGSPLSATQCGSCHAQYFDEWSRSVHAHSLISENFLTTFSQYLESLSTQARDDPQSAMACLNCHAPLLKHARPEMIRQVRDFIVAKETKKLAGFEIGCVACHLDGTRVFSGPIARPQDNPFHASKFSASYKEASFCANCHTWAASTVPCSDVYTDWKKSRATKRGATCQSCHMGEASGSAASGGPQRKIHGHLFPGGRSPAMLQQAVTVRLSAAFRKDRLQVTATVRNLVPHRVPDG
jgi:Cytochrome c554 and c-prime